VCVTNSQGLDDKRATSKDTFKYTQPRSLTPHPAFALRLSSALSPGVVLTPSLDTTLFSHYATMALAMGVVPLLDNCIEFAFSK